MATSGFTAATWNVFNKTPARELAPILRKQLDAPRHTSVLLMQEADGGDLTDMVRAAGLRTFATGQYRVAWDPGVWELVDSDRVRLADQEYFRVGGSPPQHVDAAVVLLRHKPTGKVVCFMSYHLAPYVQQPRATWRRVKSTRQAAASWRRLSRPHPVCCFGGDDNVDEDQARGGPWRFMRRAATGLRQWQAPRPTHGNRWIDDFRTRGLTSDHAWTDGGGGDHRLHGRRFTFR